MAVYEKVKTAMLAVQRYPWEQGVCAQALFEAEDSAFIVMAHDAVLRQTCDGRLAVISAHEPSVTDPAANGEPIWRAYERTGDKMYKKAAEKMLDYYMNIAPRTSNKLICHNTVSFVEGYSPEQIWVDSLYMLPPFFAVLGELDEAQKQTDGYLDCLTDSRTGLLYHIYDAGTSQFVRDKLWATGNGWALLGLGRLIDLGCDKYIKKGTALLESMLEYQCESGLFCDILDEPNSFEDGTSAMMTAAFIYRGAGQGWLERKYLKNADLVQRRMRTQIDEHGIIRGVCGCPHFTSPGTSAEAQAAYIMMESWRMKL